MAMRAAPIRCTLALLLASTSFADPVRTAELEPGQLVAEAEPRRTETSATAPRPGTEVAPKLPLYRLPPVGKPRRRVGGGRRGGGAGETALFALVPDHVGVTGAASPVLYWVLEGRAEPGARFELTLSDDRSIEPLVEARIASPSEPGLARVRLAEHGVALETGVEYQWSIALVLDPDDRSSDLVTTGWIERVADPRGPPAGAAEAAARGLWYDALDLAYARAERGPGEDADLEALLAQVGLGSLRLASR
jgi:hypothetical protein